MSLTVLCIIGAYIGLFLLEALDGFKATKGLAREIARQWRWIGRRARRLISNAQLGQPRTCTTCGFTAVPRPWTPGWTPHPPDGWTCPTCTRKRTR